MNSAIEDILAFRTCCSLKMFDQNLEIHITNQGNDPLTIPSYLDLEMEEGTKRIATLTPAGDHRLLPGDLMAFYCSMDETLWDKVRGVTFYDKEGNGYSTPIIH
ncbi:MAG: hypothetical protein HY879_04875 [Deltaproteobacteria bacterium]|nr:hypothetical protein [Deltaproteobacteria bacterium]